MDTAWGDLFAKAEGSADVSVSLPASVDNQQEELQRKRKRKKKSHRSTNTTHQEQEDAFCAMLKSRMQVPHVESFEWPNCFQLGGSLGKFASRNKCSEFHPSDKEGHCQNCQQSALYHRISVVDDADADLHVFCNLRNIRNLAKLWIWHPTTKAKRITRGLKEEWKALNNHLSLASRNIPSSEASLLETKTQRLVTNVQNTLQTNQHPLLDELVSILISCDDVYYRLYYLQITRQLPSPRKMDGHYCFLPHPTQYFGLAYLTSDPTIELEGCQDFLACINKSSDGKDDKSVWKDVLQRVGIREDGTLLDSATTGAHPLLALRRFRFLETLSIFHHNSQWTKLESTQQEIQRCLLVQDKKGEEEEETPAPTLLVEWRNSCRDFLCHLYAYATLSTQSLEAIPPWLAKNNISAGILEYGAGTGYLGKLLSAHGVAVRPFDVCPMSTTSKSAPSSTSTAINDFHGLTPSFLRVHRGSVASLHKELKHSTSKASDVALLLCYPPPHSNMAYDMLKTYCENGGTAFVHIGEFRGLTGNSTFEKYLVQHFECQGRYPCISWGTDASEVTLWMRQQQQSAVKGESEKQLLLPCSYCGKEEAVRRCRLLRYLVYCSPSCCQKDTTSRDKHLGMNMIEFGQNFRLDFQNEKDFSKLS